MTELDDYEQERNKRKILHSILKTIGVFAFIVLSVYLGSQIPTRQSETTCNTSDNLYYSVYSKPIEHSLYFESLSFNNSDIYVAHKQGDYYHIQWNNYHSSPEGMDITCIPNKNCSLEVINNTCVAICSKKGCFGSDCRKRYTYTSETKDGKQV